MKKIQIKKFTVFFGIVFALAMVFAFNPVGVSAQLSQKDGPCTNDDACDVGLFCKFGTTCQPSILGTDCQFDKDICAGSLTCDQSTHKCVQASGQPPAGGNPSTSNPPAGGNPTAANPCGDDRLESKNGLCIPKGNFPDKSIAGASTLTGLILIVINYLLILAGLIAVVTLIVGGFWYITAAGNEELAEKGRKTLMSSVMGLVIVILAYAIVNIIVSTLTTTDILNKP